MIDSFWLPTKKHCAVITGASSGIGEEFARKLGRKGYFLILTGRKETALENLRNEIGKEKCTVIPADLSDTKSCIDFYAQAKKYAPDILINCAGFGVYGDFTESSLSKEIKLIDVNVKAMHILFKLFLRDFARKNSGYILNVASVAGFMPGPLMAAYYASKSYVIRLTYGVNGELRRRKSRVKVSVLCPGPVSTDFNKNAGITGFFKGISAGQCVDYALKQMKKGKQTIIPAFNIKLIAAAAKLFPEDAAAFGAYCIQKGKKRIEDK